MNPSAVLVSIMQPQELNKATSQCGWAAQAKMNLISSKINQKIIKGVIQMKRNQNFDHNHSQKVFSCRYNMDTNRVEARFEDGTTLSIDCIAIEDEYSNTPAQRAELDWLLI